MMARNLRVFLKVYAEIKRKSKKELENFTQALIMDKKMEEIEKQNLENRMFILGGTNPTRFFNTHQRVYEKINMNNYNTACLNDKYDNNANNPMLQIPFNNSFVIHK